jgi:hypothetical protein
MSDFDLQFEEACFDMGEAVTETMTDDLGLVIDLDTEIDVAAYPYTLA